VLADQFRSLVLLTTYSVALFPDQEARKSHFDKKIDVLVPRLLPRNTLPPRLLPRELVGGGRSLQCSAFQGWNPGTRIDSLIPSRVAYNVPRSSASRETSVSGYCLRNRLLCPKIFQWVLMAPSTPWVSAVYHICRTHPRFREIPDFRADRISLGAGFAHNPIRDGD